jgi:hypothetical protein
MTENQTKEPHAEAAKTDEKAHVTEGVLTFIQNGIEGVLSGVSSVSSQYTGLTDNLKENTIWGINQAFI